MTKPVFHTPTEMLLKKQRATVLISSTFTEIKQKLEDKKQKDKTKNGREIWIIIQVEEEAKYSLKEY
jgi:hypothetical protein